MNRVFRSKRDTWIVALVWAGALLAAFGASAQFTGTAAFPERAAVLILSVFVVAMFLWMLYSIEYTLTDRDLLVRCGPFRSVVPLAEIDSAKPSRNLLSSPAASLDRLMIKWQTDQKRILISPLRKEEFLKELNSRCPQLASLGDSLVRVS